MHPVLVALLFGAVPAFFLGALEGQAVRRRQIAQIQASRRAIAEESAILKGLDPDSPGAEELGAIVQGRLDLYTGRRVVRPRLRRHLVMWFVWVTMATWMAIGLRHPSSNADQFIKGAFCGFFAALALLTLVGIFRAMRAHRRQLRRAIALQGASEGASTAEPDGAEAVQ